MQACDAEVAKHGQAYYAVIAANPPSAVKAPPAKAAPARPNSAKPNALAASQLAVQVGAGLGTVNIHWLSGLSTILCSPLSSTMATCFYENNPGIFNSVVDCLALWQNLV